MPFQTCNSRRHLFFYKPKFYRDDDQMIRSGWHSAFLQGSNWIEWLKCLTSIDGTSTAFKEYFESEEMDATSAHCPVFKHDELALLFNIQTVGSDRSLWRELSVGYTQIDYNRLESAVTGIFDLPVHECYISPEYFHRDGVLLVSKGENRELCAHVKLGQVLNKADWVYLRTLPSGNLTLTPLSSEDVTRIVFRSVNGEGIQFKYHCWKYDAPDTKAHPFATINIFKLQSMGYGVKLVMDYLSQFLKQASHFEMLDNLYCDEHIESEEEEMNTPYGDDLEVPFGVNDEA